METISDFFRQFKDQIDLHEAMLKELNAIRSRQRTQNKWMACDYAIEALGKKLQAFKKEEPWFTVEKDKFCPDCGDVLFRKIGPGNVIICGWIKLWCPHCKKHFDIRKTRRVERDEFKVSEDSDT